MKHGFSLVELSIVLVILGLLVGGIMTGQNLIRAAELRSVTSEFQQYQTAVNLFKEKYFAIPGDMKNATQFWDAADSGDGIGSDCYDVVSTGTETCNGNADGSVTDATNEMFRFWQHLANAGLIEGAYTGTAGSGGVRHHIHGTNAPNSKLSAAGWSIYGLSADWGGDTSTYALKRGNYLIFGKPAYPAPPLERLLTPEEAWNIDTKIDNGKPGKGKLLARFWDNECADSISKTDFDGNYRLNDSTPRCAFFFNQVF